MNDPRTVFLVAALLLSTSNKLQIYGCVRTFSPAEITCPSQSVADGVVSYTPDTNSHFEGTEATYTCGNGFTALGTQSIVCLPDGQWSGTLGACERRVLVTNEGMTPLECGLLTTNDPFAKTITYDPTTRTQGSIATLVCMNGFAVFGDDQRICQADGTFSSSFGTCEPTCPDYPNDDPNANPIVYDATPHFLASGITRTCKPGFVIVQPNEGNCIEIPAGSDTLNWDMTLGLCAPAGK